MALTETPEQLEGNDNEGKLVPLVRALIACSDVNEAVYLQTRFYDSFRERFYDRLRKVASKLYSGIPDFEGRTDEVFNETFVVAFVKIKEFEMGDWGDDECEKVMLNWLSTIANNLLLKIARSVKKERRQLRDFKAIQKYDLVSKPEQARKTPQRTFDKIKFDQFWAGLNPLSKDILLACIDHGTISIEGRKYISENEIEMLTQKNMVDGCAVPKDLKKFVKAGEFKERNTDHLPDEILEELKTKYNVKAAAIRKAKQRALEGLRNCKI
ncbi:MAG TPA: hypothetical protein DDZ56_01110 [Cytophagales bacterium]|nr:hypothetical protein [Cytophagales bacterium]